MDGLEEFSGKDPSTADGVIRCICMSPDNRMQAFAIVKNKVDGPTMRRFVLAMKSHLENKNCRFDVQLKLHPLLQWIILLETPEVVFKKELGWFIECLRQARVMTNPIVSNLTRVRRKLI